jgi:hypothetical protein
MSIETSFLRTISIVLLKKIFSMGNKKTGLKPQRITPRLWKLSYDKINPRGTHFFLCIINGIMF